jgi:hypothetical protein
VWINRLEAIINSEHTCDLAASVARMFEHGRTGFEGDAKAVAHVACCEAVWKETLLPVLHKAQQDWGKSHRETQVGHCTLCKLKDIALPIVKMTCQNCDELIPSDQSACYSFVSHSAHVILCARCGLDHRSRFLDKEEWVVGQTTFWASQVHVVTGSVLCGAKTEEAVQCACGQWEHAVCVAAVNPRLLDPDTVHVCNDCLRNAAHYKACRKLNPDDDPYRATKVPHAQTERASFLTTSLKDYLKGKGIKERFVVLEACRTMKTHDMDTAMRTFLKKIGGEATEGDIRFRFNVFLLVHLNDESMQDTLVGAINLHEYVSGPANGTAYVSYLDGLNHVPSSSRSVAIQGFFAMVAKSAACLGMTSMRLYALSPDGQQYIFWERPEDMLLSEDPEAQQKHLLSRYVPSFQNKLYGRMCLSCILPCGASVLILVGLMLSDTTVSSASSLP